MSAVATLSGRFTLIVMGLRAVLAAHMVRADQTRPLLLLMWGRLGQLDRRMAILMQRFAAGRSVAPRLRPPAQTRAKRQVTRLRLPAKPGWLIIQAIQVAPYAEQVRRLLEQPEMLALLDAAPQLKRQLRPILRALMPELPPSLALPPRPPRPPRVKPVRTERPRKPRRAPCHGACRPKEFWRPGPIRPLWTA
jgi:hypothetical protein